MSPFSTTVFRIRLLLLACALGLMGTLGDKKPSRIAENAQPIKSVKASQRKPAPKSRIVAVSEVRQVAR
jgi:hypothetical protein